MFLRPEGCSAARCSKDLMKQSDSADSPPSSFVSSPSCAATASRTTRFVLSLSFGEGETSESPRPRSSPELAPIFDVEAAYGVVFEGPLATAGGYNELVSFS